MVLHIKPNIGISQVISTKLTQYVFYEKTAVILSGDHISYRESHNFGIIGV